MYTYVYAMLTNVQCTQCYNFPRSTDPQKSHNVNGDIFRSASGPTNVDIGPGIGVYRYIGSSFPKNVRGTGRMCFNNVDNE